MSKPYILRSYDKLLRLPFGRQIFSIYAARKAPYFRTIRPLVQKLEAGHCEIALKKRSFHSKSYQHRACNCCGKRPGNGDGFSGGSYDPTPFALDPQGDGADLSCEGRHGFDLRSPQQPHRLGAR